MAKGCAIIVHYQIAYPPVVHSSPFVGCGNFEQFDQVRIIRRSQLAIGIKIRNRQYLLDDEVVGDMAPRGFQCVELGCKLARGDGHGNFLQVEGDMASAQASAR